MTTKNNTEESSKGGTCKRCGVWKGGSFGINGVGEQTSHKCRELNNTEEWVVQELLKTYRDEDGDWFVEDLWALPAEIRHALSTAKQQGREEAVDFIESKSYLIGKMFDWDKFWDTLKKARNLK